MQAVVDIGLGLAGGRAESEGGIDWWGCAPAKRCLRFWLHAEVHSSHLAQSSAHCLPWGLLSEQSPLQPSPEGFARKRVFDHLRHFYALLSPTFSGDLV